MHALAAPRMNTVHLVDGSLYVCRAWFSQVPDVHDADGSPAHAVHGFTRFLLDLFERARPTHIAVAFDQSLTTSFRNALYPAYKANRPPAPADLVRQFAGCMEVAGALGATVLVDSRYEADDLIGSAVVRVRSQGFRNVIISADKDFGQLITAADEQWDFSRDERWDVAGVKRRLGVRPDQVVDFLALTGDSVDNIPGVPGIGPKTAATLLAHFDTLDALLARLEEVPFLRLRGAGQAYVRIKQHREQALMSRMLSAIALDAPVPALTEQLLWRRPDTAVLDPLFDQLKFGPLTRSRCRALAPQAQA
jgi:DNA polymerase-1